MTIESPKPTLTSIQILRGIAATMVVVLHIGALMDRIDLGPVAHPAFGAGVDIFFVISGFIMWYTTANRSVTPSGFMTNRIVRIVPLYWAITTVLVAAMTMLPGAFKNSSLEASHVITSYLFIPDLDPAGNYWPVLIPGWTLNYEMFFYLIFAAALLVGNRLARAGVIIATLAVLVLLPALAGPPEGRLSFYTDPIMLEFAFGIVVGEILLWWRPAPARVWWLVASVGAVALAVSNPAGIRAVVWGGPAVLIVVGALFGPPLRCAPLERLGDASYSLYLTHPLTISVVGLVAGRLGLAWWAVPPIALAACIIVGFVTFRIMEDPLTQVLKPKARRLVVQE